MNIQALTKNIGWLFGALLLQVLVLNRVSILGIATPVPYIFFLLTLPSDTPRWAYIVMGFALGLGIDLFMNTPGMTAGALCFQGLLTPLLLKAFTPHDGNDSIIPSHKTMEWDGFIKYIVFSTLIYCTLLFTIEFATFTSIATLLLCIILSTVLTLLFILAFEALRSK